MTRFSREHNARVARSLRRRKGYELTPEEVGAIRARSLAKLRVEFADMNPPAGDEEFFKWIAAHLGPPPWRGAAGNIVKP